MGTHALAEVLGGTPLGPIVSVVAARMHVALHTATNLVAPARQNARCRPLIRPL